MIFFVNWYLLNIITVKIITRLAAINAAPSASSPFLPNLNQHVVLDPLLQGPVLEVGLQKPKPLRTPLNCESRL
ncbi:hypothetical protein Hanom_Chr06g00558941 [Helianthus anomalus]